jgi:hypothetical protein
MVARPWGWDFPHMLGHFGWKAALGIVIGNALAYLAFHRQLRALSPSTTATTSAAPRRVPTWVIAVNLCFMAWTVVNAHYPPLHRRLPVLPASPR